MRIYATVIGIDYLAVLVRQWKIPERLDILNVRVWIIGCHACTGSGGGGGEGSGQE